jgi:hypothetical protein
MVNFMGKLFGVLAGEIYLVYADNKGMITFDKFLEFTKDHDIFPKVATKASIHTIFLSLALLNDVLAH